jgi:methylglutaconyl-CoA hydratase
MNSTIITKTQGCVLQVVLNRPEKCNSFNPQLIDALTRVFGELASGAAPELRLVHISGSGSVFCAGADLQWMQASRNLSEEANYHDADRLFLMYQAMQKCPVPVVTQVHGAVFGGGIGLCSVSDIVIADTQSYFSLSETRRGLIPAVMMPFVIEKLGKSRTRELTITGRTFTAEEAVAYGLVHFISTPKTRKSVTESVIQNTIASAPEAIRESRDLIGRSSDRSFESLRHDLVHTLSQKRSGAEAQEGLSAFFEKREPAWATAPWSLDYPQVGGLVKC